MDERGVLVAGDWRGLAEGGACGGSFADGTALRCVEGGGLRLCRDGCCSSCRGATSGAGEGSVPSSSTTRTRERMALALRPSDVAMLATEWPEACILQSRP